jgi:hypothetical protein
MATEGQDWREDAKAIYRDALSTLLASPETSADYMVEFFKEELREALLDLKQAVIADRMADALVCVQEVRICLIELKQRLQGDS